MSLPGRQEGNQRPPMAFFACHRFGPLPKGVKDGSPLPAPAFAPLPLPGAAGSARLWPRALPKTAHPRLHRRHRRILSASPCGRRKAGVPSPCRGRRGLHAFGPVPCRRQRTPGFTAVTDAFSRPPCGRRKAGVLSPCRGRRACASPAPCPVGDSASSRPSPGLIPVPRRRFLSAPPLSPSPAPRWRSSGRPPTGRAAKKSSRFCGCPLSFRPALCAGRGHFSFASLP